MSPSFYNITGPDGIFIDLSEEYIQGQYCELHTGSQVIASLGSGHYFAPSKHFQVKFGVKSIYNNFLWKLIPLHGWQTHSPGLTGYRDGHVAVQIKELLNFTNMTFLTQQKNII